MVGVKKKVADAAPAAAKESPAPKPLDCGAAEQELRSMAWFAMWHSSQRMRRLASQARSAELQAQLSWLIAQLDKHAAHLNKGTGRNTGEDDAEDVRPRAARVPRRTTRN